MNKCENCGNKHNGDYASGRFCSKKCSKGFSTKSKRKEINEKVSITLKGHISCLKNKKLSEEHKRKISLNNKGGTCKWYVIKRKNGVETKVQGTYELRFAKILENIDEDWIKPSIWNRGHQFRWIDKKGKSHWYTPDFWSPKLGKYFEIKGFWPKKEEERKHFVEGLDNVEILYLKNLKELEK